MSEPDNRPPWVRAGGFPQGDWLDCLRYSRTKWMSADAGLKGLLERDDWYSVSPADFDRLIRALDKAYADHREMLAGHREVVARLLDERARLRNET